MSVMTARLYDGAGNFLALLPQTMSVNTQDVLNEEGSGTLSYPATGRNADLLRRLGETVELADCMAAVHLDGQEVFRFLLDEDEGDEADEAANARQLQLGGAGSLGVLTRGVVLPGDGIGSVPATHKFVNRTAGSIMLHLLDAMKRLGYLTQVDVSFTAARDSAGQPWDTWIDVEYDAGKDLLTVVKDLAAQGTCDVRMRGLTLELFNANTVLAADRPGIYVRRAHAPRAPRKRSRRNLRTDFLVVGDEGVNALRFDSEARARFGKRIGFISRGDTVTADSLYRVGDEALRENARPSTGYTLDLRLGVGTCPQPYVDFGLGDTIRSDFALAEGGGYEPLRVKAITLTFGDESGATGCSLEVNDRFAESILDLTRKIEGIRHGKMSGTSRPPSEPAKPPDTTVPTRPAAIRTRGQLSYTAEGNQTATVEVSWPPVATNDENPDSPIDDLDHYEVRFKFVDRAVEEPQDPGGDDGPSEPPPPPVYELTEKFRDNFDRPDAANVQNGWRENGGDWRIRNLRAYVNAQLTVLLRSYATRDIRVDADLDSQAGTPAVVVRGNPNVGISAGYVALYSPTNTGTNVELRKDGKAVSAVHVGPVGNFLGPGPHRLSVDLRGKTLTVFVDDVQALSWTDPGTLPTGTHVGVGTFGKTATACDSFVVSEWVEQKPLTATGDPVADGEFIDPEYVTVGTTQETGVLITGLPTSTRVQVEVRAVDVNSNASDWQIAEVFLTPGDDAPPPAPGTPTLTPRLGGVEVVWPRATFDGGALPPDYDEVEVFAGPTQSFVPDTTTRLGSLIGTTGFFTGLPYGIPVWFRLVLVDRVGNRSVPSQAVRVVPKPLVSAEIGLAQVLSNNLASGAVGSDKLTVGVLHDSMLLNAGFEEKTDSGLPVAWEFSAASLGSYAIDETLPKEGRYSIRLRPSSSTIPAHIRTLPHYPVTSSTWYYVSAWWKGSEGSASTRVIWYDANRVRLASVVVGQAVELSPEWQNGLGLVRSPETARFARVELQPNVDTVGTDVWVDAADLRLATGSAQIIDASIGSAEIADLAVSRAKIGLAAVGEAQIGSLTVNKLVAGELSATYVTVTGRLTSKAGGVRSGARWELDGDGFRLYRSDGTEVVRMASDGTARFAGELSSGTLLTAPRVEGGTIRAAKINGGTFEGGTFRSVSALTTLTNYVEIGNTGNADPVDEIRMITGTSAVGIRNPSAAPGEMWLTVGSDVTGTAAARIYRISRTQLDTSGASILTRTGKIDAGGGVFDTGQRVYSAANPPPPPSFRSRDIGGSYLSTQPLFTGSFGDYNNRIGYESTFGGGLHTRGFGTGLAVFTHGYSSTSPTAYANNAGEWRVATRVYANGVQLSSSAEHKQSVEPVPPSLGRIRRLRPVNYQRLNDTNGRAIRTGPQPEVGLIAEETVQVCPEVAPDGRSVDLMALTTLLVKSVQELADLVAPLPPRSPTPSS